MSRFPPRDPVFDNDWLALRNFWPPFCSAGTWPTVASDEGCPGRPSISFGPGDVLSGPAESLRRRPWTGNLDDDTQLLVRKRRLKNLSYIPGTTGVGAVSREHSSWGNGATVQVVDAKTSCSRGDSQEVGVPRVWSKFPPTPEDGNIKRPIASFAAAAASAIPCPRNLSCCVIFSICFPENIFQGREKLVSRLA